MTLDKLFEYSAGRYIGLGMDQPYSLRQGLLSLFEGKHMVMKGKLTSGFPKKHSAELIKSPLSDNV